MATKKQMARSEEFKTPECRVSYAQQLFKPRAFKGGNEKYGCTLIFPNSAKALFEKHIRQVILDEWGEKGLKRAAEGLINNPLLRGDGKSARNKETGELHPGMGPDVFFIRVTSINEPVILYKSKTIPATGKEIFSGDYGFAVVNCFAYPAQDGGSDGVGIGINYFQKLRDGERLGSSGKVDVDKYYEKIDDSGDAPDETKSGAGAGGLFGE